MTVEPELAQVSHDERGVAPAVSALVVVIALGFGVAAVFVNGSALIPVVFAVGAVALGVMGGVRGAVAGATFGFGLTSIVVAHDLDPSSALAVHATTTILCFGLIVGSEASFSARRNSVVAPGLFVRVAIDHIEILVLGLALGAAVALVSSPLTPPGWLILLPVIALALGAIAGYRELRNRKAKLSPPPPRPQDLRRAAVPVASRSSAAPPPPGSRRPQGPPPPIPLPAQRRIQQPPPPPSPSE